MELKHTFLNNTLTSSITFNRTNMELKQEWDKKAYEGMLDF